jgi:hypothetical protein
MYTSLKLETLKHQALKQRLLGNWPDCDEETLRDTLEGITDLHEMIAAVIRSALVDEALQAGLRTRLEEMRQRLNRLEERCGKKRQLALETMCEVGLKKLEQPDFTVFRPCRHAVPHHRDGGPRSPILLGAATTQARSSSTTR